MCVAVYDCGTLLRGARARAGAGAAGHCIYVALVTRVSCAVWVCAQITQTHYISHFCAPHHAPRGTSHGG